VCVTLFKKRKTLRQNRWAKKFPRFRKFIRKTGRDFYSTVVASFFFSVNKVTKNLVNQTTVNKEHGAVQKKKRSRQNRWVKNFAQIFVEKISGENWAKFYPKNVCVVVIFFWTAYHILVNSLPNIFLGKRTYLCKPEKKAKRDEKQKKIFLFRFKGPFTL